MSIAHNPLKQYFRRPSVYFKLPSGGKGYKPGVVNIPESGELPVYPMTAIDEITTKTPDALFNGTAMVEIIKSCVPDIKDPWAITSVDLDAILIAIRAAGGGSELEIESECPSCHEVSSYGVNLSAMLANMKAGNYSEDLRIHDLSITFRPLTYKELNKAGLAQFEIQRVFSGIEKIENEEERNKKTQDALRSITLLTMEVLAQAIEIIRTPGTEVTEQEFIIDFLQNCDKNTYIAIRDFHSKLKEQTELKPLHIKCVSCTHEYDQPFTLNPSDFFG